MGQAIAQTPFGYATITIIAAMSTIIKRKDDVFIFIYLTFSF